MHPSVQGTFGAVVAKVREVTGVGTTAIYMYQIARGGETGQRRTEQNTHEHRNMTKFRILQLYNKILNFVMLCTNTVTCVYTITVCVSSKTYRSTPFPSLPSYLPLPTSLSLSCSFSHSTHLNNSGL